VLSYDDSYVIEAL